MSRQQEKSQPQATQSTTNNQPEDLSFDQWAVSVKRQMIASLKRRGAS
ncbi:MAG TPA: hypothetical protein IGS37_04375 [Synechococcales cyanobacterium M55_K2018_004]|nr:hypothetical protein [Synechococcales cyanobacterium M55_K2018_004]